MPLVFLGKYGRTKYGSIFDTFHCSLGPADINGLYKGQKQSEKYLPSIRQMFLQLFGRSRQFLSLLLCFFVVNNYFVYC